MNGSTTIRVLVLKGGERLPVLLDRARQQPLFDPLVYAVTGEDLSGGSLTEVLAVLYPEPARTAKAEVHEDHASFLKGVVQNLNSGEGALVILGCGLAANSSLTARQLSFMARCKVWAVSAKTL